MVPHLKTLVRDYKPLFEELFDEFERGWDHDIWRAARSLWQCRNSCHEQNRSWLMLELANLCCPDENWDFYWNEKHSTILNETGELFFDILVDIDDIKDMMPELSCSPNEREMGLCIWRNL